ncbi:MAG: apolipoprotein N-acyltransferase [Actinomycetota bacterium]|nr:apolipoprotein N-acyltransferase [Actinomycetota bacterium]
MNRVAGALGAGVLITASLPPFGWWPLAMLGAAVLVTCLKDQPARWRLACGLATGLGLYGPGLWWVVDFSAPGYVVLVLVESAILAAALLLVPGGPTASRMLAFPAALVVAELVRGRWPLGGLPLAGIDLGQAGSPLAPAARLGGHLLLVGLVGLAGAALALLLEPKLGARAAAALGLVVVVGTALLGAAAGSGAPGRTLRVAAVQGGGPRGLRAIDVDPAAAFNAQLAATERVKLPVDLVVWPENAVNVDGPLDGSRQDAAMSDQARRLQATIVGGVVEDVTSSRGTPRFRNAAVAWAPDGSRVARYDKVHRVPFGEYVPARSLINRLADVSAVPRDAIAGRGPGVLSTPAGPLGAVISYEVFFSDRARVAVQGGGQVLLVPTNASSYKTGQVPAQELAAARLRALETGRDVVQSAPTGYSALVNADGRVMARSGLGRSAVIEGTVRLRTGTTAATTFGDGAMTFVTLMGLVAAWTFRKLKSSNVR